MLTRARPWLVALGVTALCMGCRGADPNVPVDGHRELCCRAANPDNVSFVGCRATSHCRANEEIWVRGPVICGLADPQACAGGRCCKLDFEVPTTRESEVAPDATRTPSGAAADQVQPHAPPPAPARISPTPLD